MCKIGVYSPNPPGPHGEVQMIENGGGRGGGGDVLTMMGAKRLGLSPGVGVEVFVEKQMSYATRGESVMHVFEHTGRIST
jgi:hypothetical protein